MGVKYRTVVVAGQTLFDGQRHQLFQLAAQVLNNPLNSEDLPSTSLFFNSSSGETADFQAQEENAYFQCIQPTLISSHVDKLTLGSKSEVLDTLRLKRSQFDGVREDGSRPLYYSHRDRGSIKTVEEKTALVGLLQFLSGLSEPVVLFLHYKDALLPTLLAKLNHYKLLDHFTDIVLGCCDLVGLAWNLNMEHLWRGNHYPSLSKICAHVDRALLDGLDDTMSADTDAKLLAGVVTSLLASRGLSLAGCLDSGNRVTLLEYMSVKYSLLQAVRCTTEELAQSVFGGDRTRGREALARTRSLLLPEFLEVVASQDTWGNKTRLQLIWNRGQVSQGVSGGVSCGGPRAPPPPPGLREEEEGEEQVRILQHRGKVVSKWKRKVQRLTAPGDLEEQGLLQEGGRGDQEEQGQLQGGVRGHQEEQRLLQGNGRGHQEDEGWLQEEDRGDQWERREDQEKTTYPPLAEEVLWDDKTYNAFLCPGESLLAGKSLSRLSLRVPALKIRLAAADPRQTRWALVEQAEDFTLCQILQGVGELKQSDKFLFPVVEAEFKNCSYHDVLLNSENISYPVAIVRIQK